MWTSLKEASSNCCLRPAEKPFKLIYINIFKEKTLTS
jgi:hypothetical protein